MGDYFKGINSFDYIESHKQVTKEFAQNILNEVFDENKMILSIVKRKWYCRKRDKKNYKGRITKKTKKILIKILKKHIRKRL